MRDAGCGMRDAGCGMRDAGCGMGPKIEARYKIQETLRAGYGMKISSWWDRDHFSW